MSVVERMSVGADVVYDGLGTPRADGVVTVQRAGPSGDPTIVAVETRREWQARQRADAPLLRGGAALGPPPVNAHVHLDLSRMPQQRGGFVEFTEAVVAHGRAGHRGLAAARDGLDEVLASGVRVIGDIVTDETVMRWLLERDDLEGVAYWEVLAPDPADADDVFDATVRRLRAFRELERPGGVHVGLSPHAPHTVSPPLLAKLARLAAANDVPMQIHVSETADELAFHRDGSGPYRELMDPWLGSGWRPAGVSPVALLDRLGVLEARPTLVHAVHVDEDDIRAIQRAGCAVVHCPRSNEALGSGVFPWAAYMRHGVTVAFGTDSRGSSPDLSLLAEVAAAVELHGAALNPRAWLRAATKGGYRALGMTPPTLGRGDPASRLVAWPDAGFGPSSPSRSASLEVLPDVLARG